MSLLVDTDAFCKFGVCDGLFELVVAAVDSPETIPYRLPALPHMLKRGRLSHRLGKANCNKLLDLAITLPELKIPGSNHLDLMTREQNIDPGEAQLFAACIEQHSNLITADKRAIRSVAMIEAIRPGLRGRLITLEAALLAVGKKTDLNKLKQVIQPATAFDTMLQVCFSAGNSDPNVALTSYLKSFIEEVGEDFLWLPTGFTQ